MRPANKFKFFCSFLHKLMVVTALCLNLITASKADEKKQDALIDDLDHTFKLPIFPREGEAKLEDGIYKNGSSLPFSVKIDPATLKELSKLQSDIEILENDVNQLATKLQLARQKLSDETRLTNLVALETTLASSDIASLHALTITLDGQAFYKKQAFEVEAGLSGKQLIFLGPLAAGDHKLVVSAQMARLHPHISSAGDSIYRVVERNFSFNVPLGDFKHKWTITIMPSPSSDKPDQIELAESPLKL